MVFDSAKRQRGLGKGEYLLTVESRTGEDSNVQHV